MAGAFSVGDWQVDPSLRTLTCGDRQVHVEPKVMHVLELLAASPGRVIPKDELLQAVWPDTFVGDEVLARVVSELRRAFGDDSRAPRYIQTIPKGGYRLVAPVRGVISTHADHVGAESRSQGTPGEPAFLDEAARRSTVEQLLSYLGRPRVLALLMTAVAVLAGLTVVIRFARPQSRSAAEPAAYQDAVLTRLRQNPMDQPGAVPYISPDGRYLAVSDSGGVEVRVIATGEAQRLPDTTGMTVYGWSPDSTRVRAALCQRDLCDGWSVPVLGNSRYRVDGTWASSTPIMWVPKVGLFQAGDTLTLQPEAGGPPRTIATHISLYSPSPSGDYVLYVNAAHEDGIQRIELRGPTAAASVWTAPRGLWIQDLVVLSERRVMLALRRTAPGRGWEWALHEVYLGIGGRTVAKLRRVTDWRPDILCCLSASADGTRVVFGQGTGGTVVYVAEFDRTSCTVGKRKRFGTGDHWEVATGWTPDGKSLLVASDKNADLDIYDWPIDQDSSKPLVVAPGPQISPTVSSNGESLFYLELAADLEGPARLLRTAVSGGTGQPTSCPSLNSGDIFDMRLSPLSCSSVGRCIFTDSAAGQIRHFDLTDGCGNAVRSIPERTREVSLLPTGDSAAYVVRAQGRQNHIRIVSLDGSASRELPVPNANKLSSLIPLPGEGGFVAVNERANPDDREVLLIASDGAACTAWRQRGLIPRLVIPSPDSKRLAVTSQTGRGEVWMIKDFDERSRPDAAAMR